LDSDIPPDEPMEYQFRIEIKGEKYDKIISECKVVLWY